MSATKWSLVVAPFSAVGELKDAPMGLRAPVREHTTPFNTAGHLPVARGGGGARLFTVGRLAGAHNQSVPRSGRKIVLVLENS
jgi:hypothetical protein